MQHLWTAMFHFLLPFLITFLAQPAGGQGSRQGSTAASCRALGAPKTSLPHMAATFLVNPRRFLPTRVSQEGGISDFVAPCLGSHLLQSDTQNAPSKFVAARLGTHLR